MSSETIAAISTPNGKGGISIVRISGQKALEIAKTLSQRTQIPPRKATLCNIFLESSFIDEAITLFFKSPHSYTGEDVVEIQCHGGDVISGLILQEILRLGARLARPGEFTLRSYLNNKMDLSKALAISDLINSKSAQSAKLLARQMKGDLGKFIERSRAEILKVIAYCEAMIDYSEDIEDTAKNSLSETLKKLSLRFKEILEFSEMRKATLNGHALSIIGKPNVGKSSLLNALLQDNRAIVSSIAGTTRDTITDTFYIDGHPFSITDTAGIRKSEDEIEAIGIEKSLESLKECDVVLFVLDSSKPIEEIDLEIALKIQCEIALRSIDVIILQNKLDLESRLVLESVPLEKQILKDALKISLASQEDRAKSALMIKERLKKTTIKTNSNELLLTKDFQVLAIKNALLCLQSALGSLSSDELEFTSMHAKDAITHLNELTHPYDIDQMFDVMFGEFCLGK